MKTIFLLLTGLCTISCQMYTQSFLSPRVGNDIDQVERVYYGLFPSVKGFVSAKATSQINDSTHFIIRSLFQGVVKDTTVIVDTRTVEKLSKYIEGFESVRMDENEVNWSVFKGFAAEGSAIDHYFQNPLNATITTLDGKSITGKLFWAEDSTLVLWKSDEPYNWKTVNLDANVIPVTTISTISLEKRFRIRKGPGTIYGGIAGLAFSALYIGLNYSEISNRTQSGIFPIEPFIIPFFIVSTSVVGGIIEYLLQPNFQTTIDGKEEKYLPILPTLTNASTIDSYPPPEIIHLIDQ